MRLLREYLGPLELSDRLRSAHAVTAELLWEVIAEGCKRFPSIGQRGETTRIERLIEASAWTDLALALIELELPQWQVRRIAYDEGEWHCALSRQRELPDWLDQAVEANHGDLALAILSAFIEARRNSAPTTRTSVPVVPVETKMLYEPMCCDNFA